MNSDSKLTICFGLDIAGFSKDKNAGLAALIKYERDEDEAIQAWILENEDNNLGVERDAKDETKKLFEDEMKYLKSLTEAGDVYIDAVLDPQNLLKPYAEEDEEHKANARKKFQFVWQLQNRPVDYAFDGKSIWADRIGAVFVRMRRLLMEDGAPKLGCKIWETYPAATLKLLGLPEEVKGSKKVPEYKKYGKGYKAKKIYFNDDDPNKNIAEDKKEQTNQQAAKEQNRRKRARQILKKLKIKSAANWKPVDSGNLFVSADQLDAIICALPGVVKPEDRLEGDELEKKIRDRIKSLRRPEYEGPCEPPTGYRLISANAPNNLPKIEVCKVDKEKFDKMLARSKENRESPTHNQQSLMNDFKDLIKKGN